MQGYVARSETSTTKSKKESNTFPPGKGIEKTYIIQSISQIPHPIRIHLNHPTPPIRQEIHHYRRIRSPYYLILTIRLMPIGTDQSQCLSLSWHIHWVAVVISLGCGCRLWLRCGAVALLGEELWYVLCPWVRACMVW